MKKLALLVLLVVASTLILTACGQTVTTETIARWTNSEYDFDITLSDLAKPGASYAFEAYANATNNSTHYKDMVITTSNAMESVNSNNEIRPHAAVGSYKITINVDAATTCTVKTSQTIYVQYIETDLIDEMYNVVNGEPTGKLASFVVDNTDADNPFDTFQTTDGKNLITLKSTTDTEVVFENTPAQQPKSSKKVVNGFYIGKDDHQNVSQYKVTTTYDIANKKATVKVDDQEAVTNNLTINTTGNFIDENQLIVYARSLDKSSAAFQDVPGVTIYSPLTNKNHTAYFALSRSAKMVLNNAGNNVFVTTDNLSVAIDGIAYMLQQNVPDLTADSLDTIAMQSKTYPMFTTLRFRVGNFAYELANHDATILDKITVKAAAAE